MKKLFETDGIRGLANKYPMTPKVALEVGQALTYVIQENKHRAPRFVIGKDTRLSGYMLESALASGMCSMGADVVLVGPMPTPAVAFLTVNMDADAGVVISASHNPYQDNGIKVFSNEGYKLNDAKEREIESLISQANLHQNLPPAENIGKAFRAEDAIGRYIVFLRQTLPKHISLEGMKIVVDCAHGATYKIAPTLLREMRADVVAINASPDGKNINKNAGALYPDSLADEVKNHHAHIGLAFDGDGDRLIAVDEKGNLLTGDKILAICAVHLKNKGKLVNNTVVTTLMSNIGLSKCLQEHDINRVETKVGDRCVLESMLECGACLGGEDSGHMIFLDKHTTGDGIIAALFLLSIMNETGKKLSELGDVMTVYPQILTNIEVKEKIPVAEVPELTTTIQEVEERLKDSGRVLVRYSGTQNLLRVMVEGPTKDLTSEYADLIAETAKRRLQQ